MTIYKNQNQKGFTLVELAIVMIIIGLLIGGVLKGQELIENAKVTQTVATFKSYMAAHASFIDTYGGIPGDMANARDRVSGCKPANGCANGDGNSIVGVQIIDFNDGQIQDLNTGGVGSANQENTQYWKHLALADLITGVNPAVNTAAPVWGETNPSSPVSGGFSIGFWNYNDEPPAAVNGHAYFLTRETDGFEATTRGLGVVTAAAAANIDRKLDDGKPYLGSIWGMNPTSECVIFNEGEGSFLSLAIYNERISGKNCALWFFFSS
jgi:prepilin-type N-terminal cleavage/methylation domain-containing protein